VEKKILVDGGGKNGGLSRIKDKKEKMDPIIDTRKKERTRRFPGKTNNKRSVIQRPAGNEGRHINTTFAHSGEKWSYCNPRNARRENLFRPEGQRQGYSVFAVL